MVFRQLARSQETYQDINLLFWDVLTTVAASIKKIWSEKDKRMKI